MDNQLCLSCGWHGPTKDLVSSGMPDEPGEVCPECGSYEILDYDGLSEIGQWTVNQMLKGEDARAG